MILPILTVCLRRLPGRLPEIIKKRCSAQGGRRGQGMRRLLSIYKNRPLFQQFITAFIAVILCPILFITLFSYYNGAGEIRKRYEESFWNASEEVNGNIREKIEELDRLTLHIASQEEVKQFVMQDADDYYEKYVIKQWGKSSYS